MALYEQWDTVLINNKLESSNTTTDQTEKRLQMIKRVNHWLSQQSAYIDENFTNNTFIYYCLNSWILERKTYGPNEKSSIIRAFLYMYDMYTIVTERQIDPLRYRKVQAFVDNYNNGHKDLDKEFIEILWTRINDCNELIQNSPCSQENLV